jgi:hypothetical protein
LALLLAGVSASEPDVSAVARRRLQASSGIPARVRDAVLAAMDPNAEVRPRGAQDLLERLSPVISRQAAIDSTGALIRRLFPAADLAPPLAEADSTVRAAELLTPPREEDGSRWARLVRRFKKE